MEWKWWDTATLRSKFAKVLKIHGSTLIQILILEKNVNVGAFPLDLGMST
jgi:hypothetical protein